MTPDLFTYAERYPHVPAARKTDTSREAAEAMKPHAARLQQKVYEAIESRDTWGATANEVAELVELPYQSIQPRISELKALGKIVDSGQRRPSRTAKRRAIVWVAL